MYQKQKSTKKTLMVVLALVLICAVSVMGTLAYLSATTDPVTNTFIAAGGGQIIDPVNPDPGPNTDASIKSGFYLLESAVTYDSGNYALNNGAKLVTANTYDKVVPSMTIPKDPKLTVNVVEGVDAYIFVKVTNTTGNNLSYGMTSNWTKVTGVTLGTGETLYVYKDAVHTGIAGVDLTDIPLLTSNQVLSAATITDVDSTTSGMQLGVLKFEAYVCQAGGFDSAAAAYTACFAS